MNRSLPEQSSIAALGLSYCLLFMEFAAATPKDSFVRVFLIGGSFLLGIGTGIPVGPAALTFVVYFSVMSIIFGVTGVPPYYSHDVGWIFPVTFYSLMVLIGDAFGVFAGSIIKAFARKAKRKAALNQKDSA